MAKKDTIEGFEMGSIDDKVEGNVFQFFILTRAGNTFRYHAQHRGEGISHHSVKRSCCSAQEVLLGGGFANRYSSQMDTLYLEGFSTNSGGIPKELLENYADKILERYQKKYPELTKIVVNTSCRLSKDEWLEENKLYLSE